jgi:hypothetical protein
MQRQPPPVESRVKFFSAVFWEFVQNVPLVAGFYIALELWRQGQFVGAGASMLVGSAVGALTIWATESRIIAGHREPLRVVATNILGIALLMFVTVAYLSAAWGSWVTDLVFGALAGVALGVAQSLAAREPISIRHCLAFACSLPPALVGIRSLAASNLPVLVSILVITIVATLIIALVDYGPLFLGRRDKV